jgi:hypothetical protein
MRSGTVTETVPFFCALNDGKIEGRDMVGRAPLHFTLANCRCESRDPH